MDICQEFASFLVAEGVITAEQAQEALDIQRAGYDPIGRLAMRKRWLSMKQISRVLGAQAETGLRFGEQAVVMGLLSPGQVGELLRTQKAGRAGLGAILQSMGLLHASDLRRLRGRFVASLEDTLV